MNGLPRVHVIALGGTIAMTEGSGDGVRPMLGAEELLGSMSTPPPIELTAETASRVPGAQLRIDDILAVVRRASEEIECGAAGVVCIQGTDTLEETAFLAELVHRSAEPLVFTGAMRHPGSLGADGPANLHDAIVAAAGLRDTGVLVCLGGELHAARHVAKTHSFSPAAFTSPGLGPLGWVVEGAPHLHLRPRRGPRFELARLSEVRPSVPLYRVTLDDDGTALRAILDTAPPGLVVDAFGVGHVNEVVADLVGEAAGEVPVVFASRTGAGTTLRATYGFTGSERDLVERRLIPAGILPGSKARLLLTLALRAGDGHDEVGRRFAAWGEGTAAHAPPDPGAEAQL